MIFGGSATEWDRQSYKETVTDLKKINPLIRVSLRESEDNIENFSTIQTTIYLYKSPTKYAGRFIDVNDVAQKVKIRKKNSSN
jgi:hypothetical protein